MYTPSAYEDKSSQYEHSRKIHWGRKLSNSMIGIHMKYTRLLISLCQDLRST